MRVSEGEDKQRKRKRKREREGFYTLTVLLAPNDHTLHSNTSSVNSSINTPLEGGGAHHFLMQQHKIDYSGISHTKDPPY